jgi:hypothetical protein
MRFHFGSFLLGYGAGVTTVLVGRALRPVLVETAAAAFQVADAVTARIAMVQEDVEDILAEARARARRGEEPAGPRSAAAGA